MYYFIILFFIIIYLFINRKFKESFTQDISNINTNIKNVFGVSCKPPPPISSCSFSVKKPPPPLPPPPQIKDPVPTKPPLNCKRLPIPVQYPAACPIDCKFDPVPYEGPCAKGFKLSYNVITRKKAYGGKDCPGDNVITDEGLFVANFKKTECTPPPPPPIDCELGKSIYGNCNQKGKKPKGKIIINEPLYGGKECTGKQFINNTPVAEWEMVDCEPCGDNMKRNSEGDCINIPIDCELGEII